MLPESTTQKRPAVRINLLRAHGSPTRYLYCNRGCRCVSCRGSSRDYWASRHQEKADYDAAYRLSHRESIKARSAAYNKDHVEERRSWWATWSEAHRDDLAAYRAAHRDERKVSAAAYYVANREARLAYGRTYYDSHREQKAAYAASYLVRNREKCAAWGRNRRARLRGNGGSHSAADVRAQYDRQRGRCYWCGVKIGWRKKHVDHVTPLVLGGDNDAVNIVVACPFCNDSKGSKHPMDFAGVML